MFHLFILRNVDKTKGTKLKKRGNDINKTSEDSSYSTSGKSNIKNMLLNMGKDPAKGPRRNKDIQGKTSLILMA